MHKYIYDGPVLSFDTLIADHWRGETRAPSESKAKSNLKYQFKKQNNRIAELQTALDEANTQIVAKDSVIAEKDARILELEAQVEENNNAEIERLNTEIVRLQEALDKANADLEKINTEELQKIDEAIARLEAIVNA